MNEVENLGGKSVGNMENSHACYLMVWRHAYPPLPEILEVLRPYYWLPFNANMYR